VGKFKALLIIFLICILKPAFTFDDGDFQVWNTDVQEFKINDKTKFALEEEFRWGDNANHFFYQHYDAGVTYSLSKYFSVGGGYRHVLEDKKVGKVTKFRTENEPYLTATLFGDLKGFKLEDRSRLEYRHFDYTADSWRYRNKFTVKAPWKFTKMEIQPYAADEVFFGSSGKSFNKNRFSSGLAFNLTKNCKAEIYYMLESTRGKVKWTDANILGTKLKISF
jgi:hypothetical protein